MAYTPDQFARILEGAIPKAVKQSVEIVRVGSSNVKRDARRNVQQTAPVHHAHAFRDINYDVEAVGVVVQGEIGYDKGPGKAGNLGNLLEFGGGGDHSPPHHDLSRALREEEPRFVQAVADMGERVIE